MKKEDGPFALVDAVIEYREHLRLQDKRKEEHYTTCWHCGHDRFSAQGMGGDLIMPDRPRPTVTTQFDRIDFYWIRCLSCDVFRKVYDRVKASWVVKNQCVNRG